MWIANGVLVQSLVTQRGLVSKYSWVKLGLAQKTIGIVVLPVSDLMAVCFAASTLVGQRSSF